MSLHPDVLDRAMRVSADGAGHSLGRSIIDGAVVVYNLDEPPAWLRPILKARDENGSLRGVRVSARR